MNTSSTALKMTLAALWLGCMLAHGAQAQTGNAGQPAPAVMASDQAPPQAVSTSTRPTEPSLPIGEGQATKAWLATQSSGVQASSHRPILSGPVMRNVSKRYTDSFLGGQGTSSGSK
jgi:hypothetical protein